MAISTLLTMTATAPAEETAIFVPWVSKKHHTKTNWKTEYDSARISLPCPASQGIITFKTVYSEFSQRTIFMSSF